MHTVSLYVMPPITVKARSHHGTKSLDLTIPVKVVEEMGIKEGDVFLVQVDADNKDKLVISYVRVFDGTILH